MLKWNLALDKNFGPTNGGCQDCRGFATIDQQTGEASYNVEYYTFGHASKFVIPGAYRIASNTLGSGSIEDVAFRNPDGSKVLVALNSGKTSKPIKVRFGGESFTYELPAGAVATFVWAGAQKGETMITPYSPIQAEDYGSVSGIRTEIAQDQGGGKLAVNTKDNGYLVFNHVEFVEGTASIDARVASAAGGKLEFRLDSQAGPLIGSIDLAGTGGPQSWTTKTAEIAGASGVHDVFVVFKGNVSVNWFNFSKRFASDAWNYLQDNGNFELGDLTGWSGWSPDGQASAHKVDTDSPRSGTSKLTHWLGTGYKQTTYRTVKVPSGTYTASVWVRKDTGNMVRLEAKGYGGPQLAADAGTGGIGSWKQLVINGIQVTNGQLEIGLYSDAPAGKWASFDDAELRHTTVIASSEAAGTNAPEAPSVLAVQAQSGAKVALQWENASSAKGAVIYRATVQGGIEGPYSERTIVGSPAAAFTDSGLQGETTYCYRAAAFNETGMSAATAAVCVKTGAEPDMEAPAAPVGVRAVPAIGKVTLYWDHNVEHDFLRYRVYQNGVLVGTVEPVTETVYTADNLQDGKAYSFQISAVDRAGNESAQSDAVKASPVPVGIPFAFDNAGFEKGTLDGWSEWHPGGQELAGHVDTDNPRAGGSYKLTHWLGKAYQQTNYRTLTVPNGKYRLTVWARTGGGQKTFRLEAKQYGGADLFADMRSASGSTWTPFTIDNITVTTGKLQIGVYSDAAAGNWAAIDDFQLLSIPDYTAPVTTAAVTPAEPDGANGWHVHPVSVTLTAKDDEPGAAAVEYSLDGGATWRPYVNALTFEQDGVYALSYRATDQQGNVEEAGLAEFQIDTAAPAITVSEPLAETYSDADQLNLQLNVTDGGSGAAADKIAVSLDGKSVQIGESIALYKLSLGRHVLQAEAEDQAGNSASAEVTFYTVATVESLQKLVEIFDGNGSIDNKGIANSLQSKLDNGLKGLSPFLAEVKAQRGKHIQAEAADILIRDAQAILDGK